MIINYIFVIVGLVPTIHDLKKSIGLIGRTDTVKESSLEREWI